MSNISTFTDSIPNEKGIIIVKNISWLDVENDDNTFVYQCPVCQNDDEVKNRLIIQRDSNGYKFTEFTCRCCRYKMRKTEVDTSENFNGNSFNWNNDFDKYNLVNDPFSIYYSSVENGNNPKNISLKQVGYIQEFFSRRKEALTRSRVDYRHGYDVDGVSYIETNLKINDTSLKVN